MSINNQINELNNLPDFSTQTLSMKTADELFGNLKETDAIKEFLQDRFDKFYYIQISPKSFSSDTGNEIINEIVKRHIYYAETRPINIMLFKLNEKSLLQAQKIYEEMKAKYGDIIVMNKTKRLYMVGFFGGTQGRNNQYFIDRIKSELGDKIINISKL